MFLLVKCCPEAYPISAPKNYLDTAQCYS
uniref:Uncharacterized protein n=1 Tax=Arundo donax TaxID=35708 RepID=A0A0A9H219_ARUDO